MRVSTSASSGSGSGLDDRIVPSSSALGVKIGGGQGRRGRKIRLTITTAQSRHAHGDLSLSLFRNRNRSILLYSSAIVTLKHNPFAGTRTDHTEINGTMAYYGLLRRLAIHASGSVESLSRGGHDDSLVRWLHGYVGVEVIELVKSVKAEEDMAMGCRYSYFWN